jgi:hypothetical protein
VDGLVASPQSEFVPLEQVAVLVLVPLPQVAEQVPQEPELHVGHASVLQDWLVVGLVAELQSDSVPLEQVAALVLVPLPQVAEQVPHEPELHVGHASVLQVSLVDGLSSALQSESVPLEQVAVLVFVPLPQVTEQVPQEPELQVGHASVLHVSLVDGLSSALQSDSVPLEQVAVLVLVPPAQVTEQVPQDPELHVGQADVLQA